MQDSKSLHYVLGVALALIAVFVVVALVMINSQATNTNTSVSINNVAPTVESIFLSNEAGVEGTPNLEDDYGGGTINTLVTGSTKSVYFTGVVQDNNGATDISGVSAVIYRTAQTSSCTADKNDCYIDAACDNFTGPTSDQLYYSCGPFALQFFADSTSTGGGYSADNWTGKVTVNDGTTTGFTTLSKEMQTLLSVDIPTSINYGTLALGETTTTSTNQFLEMTQFGNDEADVELSSSAAMSCSVRGEIPVGNQEWKLSPDGDYGAGTDLTTSPVDTNVYIGYRDEDEVPVFKVIHWNIGIPSSGVEGTCTGVTVITAIAH